MYQLLIARYVKIAKTLSLGMCACVLVFWGGELFCLFLVCFYFFETNSSPSCTPSK